MPTENRASNSAQLACGDQPIAGPNGAGSVTYAGTTGLLTTTGSARSYQAQGNLSLNQGININPLGIQGQSGLQGWVSGTTSTTTTGNYNVAIGTSALNSNYRYFKEGEIYMDPDTTEWKIFISELGGWVKCEIENIKKEIDENGKKINIVTVSFDCSIAYLKKKERERTVLTEKYKEPIIVFSTFTNFNGFINIVGNDTLTLQDFNYPNYGYGNGLGITTTPAIYTTPGTYITTPIGITTNTPPYITGIAGSAGQIQYNTANLTTSIIVDNIGTTIQI